MYPQFSQLGQTITVRDGAYFPCCNRFCCSHVNGSLLRASSCAYGQRQSTLIRHFAFRKVSLSGGNVCSRSRNYGSAFFRLKEHVGERKRAQQEGFDWFHTFYSEVAFHRWVQETLSLLVRFEGGFGSRVESPLLRYDHNDGGESDPLFRWERSILEEISDGDVGRPVIEYANAERTADLRRKSATDTRLSHRCDEHCEDDDDGCEPSTWPDGHGLYSCKRQQRLLELQRDYAVESEQFTSDSRESYRKNHAEPKILSSSSGYSCRMGKGSPLEAESSLRICSINKQRSKNRQTVYGDRNFYEDGGGIKRDRIAGRAGSFARSDEIKVCLNEKENCLSLLNASVSCHEQQIAMNLADTKARSRRNVIKEYCICGGKNSKGCRNDKPYGDSSTSVGIEEISEVIRTHDTRTNNSIMEFGHAHSTLAPLSGDSRYKNGEAQRRFAKEEEASSTTIDSSFQVSKRTKESTTEHAARKHALPQLNESVAFESEVSRPQKSEEYASKHCHSSDTNHFREENKSSTQQGVWILQNRIESPEMGLPSSSQSQIRDSSSRLGTGTVSHLGILQELPMSSSSRLAVKSSSLTTSDCEQAGYAINAPFPKSQNVGSHIVNVQLHGKILTNHSDIGNKSEGSHLSTEGGDSSSAILVERSHQMVQASSEQLVEEGLPSQIVRERTEEAYLVKRERDSDQRITTFEQVASANSSNSTRESVQDGSSGNQSRGFGMQSYWQSPSSEIKGPSDEMWDVAGETFEEPSNLERLEPCVLPVSVTPGENLTEASSAIVAVEGTGTGSSRVAIVKRSSRSLWSYFAEIIKNAWSLGMGSHDLTTKSASKSSSTEGNTEAWSSGYGAEEDEELRKEKKGVSARAYRGELISGLNVSEGMGITDRTSLLGPLVDDEVGATSPMGVSENVSIRRRTSSLSNNQRWVSASNPVSGGSLSASASSRTSPEVITSLTCTIDVQKQTAVSEPGVSSLQIGSEKLVIGSHELSVVDGPRDASDRDKERSLRQVNLERSAQVQRGSFEAWEEAYRLESGQRKVDEMFMREALLEARKAADTWEVPVGAVLVQDGKVIARGCNLVEELRDSTAHAEMMCIRAASDMLKTWRLAGTTLYVTLEPCAMCAGAILQARIDTLVWGAPNKLLGADGSWVRLFSSADPEHHCSYQPGPSTGPVHPFHTIMKIRRGILATESSDVLQQFFQLRRKKEKPPESPPSCLPNANPPKFFSKIHDFVSVMFCL